MGPAPNQQYPVYTASNGSKVLRVDGSEYILTKNAAGNLQLPSSLPNDVYYTNSSNNPSSGYFVKIIRGDNGKEFAILCNRNGNTDVTEEDANRDGAMAVNRREDVVDANGNVRTDSQGNAITQDTVTHGVTNGDPNSGRIVNPNADSGRQLNKPVQHVEEPDPGPTEQPQQTAEDTEQLELVPEDEANIDNYDDTGDKNKKEPTQPAPQQYKEPKPSNISWMGDLHNALSGWASATAGNLINNRAIKNGYGTDPFRRDVHLNNQARMHAIQAGQEGGYADRDLQIGRQNNINVANAIAAGNDAVAYSNQAAKVGNRNAAALLNQETKSQANVEGQQQRSDQAWQRGVSGKRASWNANQVAEQERAGADVYNGLARDMYTTNNFAGYVSMPGYSGYSTSKSGSGNDPKQEAPNMAKAIPQNVINTLLGSMREGSGKGMSHHDKELYSYVVKKFGVKPMKPTEHAQPYNSSDSRTWEEEFASLGSNNRQAINYLRGLRKVNSDADNFDDGINASTASKVNGVWTGDGNGTL